MLTTLLVVLIGASLLSLLSFDHARALSRRSSDTRRAAAEVLDALLDAETAQRGYLVTGRETYLEPYESGRARLHPRLDRLRALVDTPEEQAQLAELARYADDLMTGVSDSIARMRAGQRDEAMTLFASDRGKELMDGARRATATLVAGAESDLERGRDRVQRGFLAALAVDGIAGFAVLVLGFALFAIDRDIRRRIDLERELRDSASTERLLQQRFAITLRSIGDAVIATDASGQVTFINSIAEGLTGWNAADAVGHPLREVFVILNETTRQPVESPVDKVMREGKVVGLANHTILLHRDGSERAIDDSAAPIRDGADGVLVGIVLVFRDVEEDRRAERARTFFSRAAAELGSSLDYVTTLAAVARLAVPDFADWASVDILDESGRRQRLGVAHVDPSKVALVEEIERRWPPDPNSARGVPNVLRTGKPELVSEIPSALLQAAARDDEHLAIIRKLQLRSYLCLPLIARGKTIGVLSFVTAESGRRYLERDVAAAMSLADRAATAIDNARLYAEAQRSQVEAERANRSKDEFLAILGHELRNPLAPITTALDLMRIHPASAHERERTIIERQLRHVVRLVDDLLDVSRIASGKVELTRRPTRLADVIGRAVEVASPLIEERRHELVVDVAADLVVSADAVRLTQVFGNLVNNAAKYTEAGGHLRIVAARRDGNIVTRVQDDGSGIAPEILPGIFELFVQQPQSLDRAAGGLGLGLAIVRSLVAQHGGTVTVRSDGVGKGSEFEVTLPALDPAALASAAEPVGVPVVRKTPTTTRLLVVDDNDDAAELLSEALSVLGYETYCAHDGPSALQMASKVRPEVALLDIGLPVMDGYELARKLRELGGLERIKLVAVTGYGQPSDKRRSQAAGFDAHLVKPISIEHLQTTLAGLAV